MILVAYRHGLRASEICDLRWEQVDFASATLHVHRVKNGKPATHPVRGDELRGLRKLQREAPPSPFVFVSERGTPFTTDGFNWLVKRAGRKAGLSMPIHAHMLRHSTGYKLAGDGHDTRGIQDYLGHRNIGNTVKYTELSPDKFLAFGDSHSVMIFLLGAPTPAVEMLNARRAISGLLSAPDREAKALRCRSFPSRSRTISHRQQTGPNMEAGKGSI